MTLPVVPRVLRVVVGDDDDAVRSALVAVFDADRRFEVVGQAATGPDSVTVVQATRPDAVLLDLRMPGGGLAAAVSLAGLRLPVTVIALSAQLDAVVVAALLRAGVRGVLTKGRVGRDLPDLVSRCVAGEVVLVAAAAAEGLRIFRAA